MTIRDAIIKLNLNDIDIMQRFYYVHKNNEIEDMLFGYCSYKDGILYSLDGDTYSLDAEISDYEIEVFDDGPMLVVHETEICYEN